MIDSTVGSAIPSLRRGLVKIADRAQTDILLGGCGRWDFEGGESLSSYKLGQSSRMSSMIEFFRHCPGCGRRFHIKLETKQLTGSEMEQIPRIRVPRRRIPAPWGEGPLVIDYSRPIIVDRDTFQYTYKCRECGHEWAEKHVEEHTAGQADRPGVLQGQSGSILPK